MRSRSRWRALASPAGAADEPIAVLVQPLLATSGGVMFGIDPVTAGPTSRRLRGTRCTRAARERRGARLRYVLDTDAKVFDFDERRSAVVATDLRRLVAPRPRWRRFSVDRRTSGAIARTGVGLLCRTVTTEIRGAAADRMAPDRSPRPPRAVDRAEHDLWVPPLAGAAEAVSLAGTATSAQLEASEVVVDVDDRRHRPAARRGDPAEARLPPGGQTGSRASPAAGSMARGLRAVLPCPSTTDRADADLPVLVDALTSRQLIAVASQPCDPAIAPRTRSVGMLTDTGRNV